MKKIMTICVALCTAMAADAQDIKLPAPDFKQKSLSMIETLQTRHSVRSFAETPLSLQEISTLCWAACGQNREDGRITSPTALNKQEIRLFVFTKEAVYEYLPSDNILSEKVKGDQRKLIAGQQDFALEAPVSLLMVIDFEKFGMSGERALMMACVDAGNVSENINLYCQSVGLATVPRASMDIEGISKLLGFSDKQLPVMNNPVGYAK